MFLRAFLRPLALALLLHGVASGSSATTDDPLTAESPWLLHDPGFPVVVRVAPFGDAAWTPSAAAPLRIPSTLLNLTVELPHLRNLSDVHVSIALFQQLSGGDVKVLADTQVAHAASYRLDVRHVSGRIALRAYVEGSIGQLPESADASADVKARAFFVRPIELAPSDAEYHLCGLDSSDDSSGDSSTSSDVGQVHTFPPVSMPRSMCRQFTMDGRVPVRQWYFDDQTDADQSYAARSREYIETLVARARAREQFYYGATDAYLYEALRKYPIADQHVLIIGSTTPWYESVCIAHGAASCTTIDYNQLRYEHPQIRTLTLAEFAAASGSHRRHFDAILSISSFEHDGLGRYGDPLSPDADLAAMRTALQYANPAGSATRLFLAVPVGPDCVVWNAQRIYGPLRLPLLVEPWTLVDSFGFQKSDFTAPFTIGHQPVFVLEPPPTAAAGTGSSRSAEAAGGGAAATERSEL
ncbi:hypothetical protein PybrP1_006788 [[Pythium] brassicae (nom. inval.)]|nr:hypothetical protein PybrP1_006788 [[Pythium] brassicae (nom. inval.)]